MSKHKILGFMTLLYGKEYLKESLLSISDHVDRMVIAYTPTPSHGIACSDPCPDTEVELMNIAQAVLGKKLLWDTNWQGYGNEGAHRDVRYKYAEGYDCILTIDADEVMIGLPEALDYAMSHEAQYYGIDGYINFFRSFEWACHDSFRPIRIERLDRKTGVQDHGCKLTIYHFSTALSEKYMRYKYKVFGHASEIKENYLDGIFYKWSPENNFPDLHPVSINLWNATWFDKTTFPDYLKEHPNYNKVII